ncbi:MAG: NAD(+) synthase [Candidatus Omnitrophica bacterium]|nr:NAD(+) synthase [Candidatus Omnitrophota bacterium]
MTFKNRLKINEKKVVGKIEEYIKTLIKERSSKGIVLGLSGGIDSAVMCALAVRALGKEKVHVFFLYDKESDKDSQRKATLVANFLGLQLKSLDITEVMKKEGVYDPFIMKIISVSPGLNRFFQKLYLFIAKERPFFSSLRNGANELHEDKFRNFMYNQGMQHVVRSFERKHIYRRKFLEKVAAEKNLTLLGAANYTEVFMGWFVKDGVDDLPISPISALYKTQIWQLAKYLNIPNEIIVQKSSPDMLKGITDENAIGIDYGTIDLIIDSIDCGQTDLGINKNEYTTKEVDYVKKVNRLSEWKRKSIHETVPVQGSFKGGFRLSLQTE